MNRLAVLRVLLTFGAVVGLLPVTLTFILGAYFFLSAAITSAPHDWVMLPVVLCAIGVSLFCIWTGWSIYALSMRSIPEVRHKGRLITGILIGTVWGVLWANAGDLPPRFMAIFLMPSLITTAMLAVTWRREFLAEQQTKIED